MSEGRERRRAKHPVLAAAAYLIVPGERRRRAAGHFRKAGFEALKGLGALAKPERPPEGSPEAERKKRKSISIE